MKIKWRTNRVFCVNVCWVFLSFEKMAQLNKILLSITTHEHHVFILNPLLKIHKMHQQSSYACMNRFIWFMLLGNDRFSVVNVK